MFSSGEGARTPRVMFIGKVGGSGERMSPSSRVGFVWNGCASRVAFVKRVDGCHVYCSLRGQVGSRSHVC